MSRVGLRSSSEGSSKLNDEIMNGKIKVMKSNNKKSILHKNTQRNKKLIEPVTERKLDEENSLSLSENTKNVSRNSISYVCSVPLERLSGILDKLSIAAAVAKHSSTIKSNNLESTNNTEHSDGEEQNKRESKNEECSYQKKHKVIKLLCLYCEKQFTSHKMQAKHVEKFHTETLDRRCSERTHINALQNNTVKNKEYQPFAGCIYCKKSHARIVIASEKDLYNLFVHMTDCHTDKYFACKPCIMRFHNSSKLSKHLQTIHKKLPLSSDNIVTNDTQSTSLEKTICDEQSKQPKSRTPKLQKTPAIVTPSSNVLPHTSLTSKTNSVVGADEPVLSRLGLTQNRLPSNKKGVRLRRETISDIAIKQDLPTSTTSSPTSKIRNKTTKTSIYNNETDIVFRVPTRTDIMSCVFDDNFYKEVVSNVRNNLLYHLDGKLPHPESSENPSTIIKHSQPQIRSTLVKSPGVLLDNPEIHAATSIVGLTAFPTLLTSEQYGGDASAKFRRPHTKHSWKWKWDSVKKFKLVNEGGKMIKKMKHPMLGLRDLSKLDMWTQLAMRQKHELYSNIISEKQFAESTREEKLRLNDQLNFILDRRLLPNIILEQNEQAVIKLENDDFGIATTYTTEDGSDNILEQTFADHSFLSVLNLLPNNDIKQRRRRLVLSGEWARPRCYLCMCCGSKFEKLKSLEEHKMFRHSHIFSTHYEVVGRELLAGNLLCHLFIPNRALCRYENIKYLQSNTYRFLLYKQQEKDNRISISVGEDESSDSVQSISNIGANIYDVKNSNNVPEDCDTDTKTTIEINTISPSHSMQSSSSFCTPSTSKVELVKTKEKDVASKSSNCTKCGRKCSGTLDLYRHMLDCSGDYIWSLAKKRKYRYYCGSKKRRPCNKQNFGLLRKSKKLSNTNREKQSTESEENSPTQTKTKTPPRPRASDAESIKKMLENLPPKRICKTILPTDNKSRMQKKGKLVAKHKIYNTHVLRKTRSRQLSQSSRLINSKKKNNFSKKINRNKNSNKNNKSNKTVLRKPKYSQPAEIKIETTPLSLQAENIIESKQEIAICNQLDEKSSVLETDVNEKLLIGNTNIAEEAPNKEIIENETLSIVVSEELKNTILPMPTKSKDHSNEVTLNINNETIVKTVIDVPQLEQIKEKNQQKQQQNTIVKRSKRISDCIAMLTGKLEEKMKTVQAEKDSTKDDTKVEPKVKPLAGNTLRTPKRKTICRRIIKNSFQMNDNCEDFSKTTTAPLSILPMSEFPVIVPPYIEPITSGTKLHNVTIQYEPLPQLLLQTETQSETQTKMQPETITETQPQTQSQTQPQTQPQTQSLTSPQTQLQTKPAPLPPLLPPVNVATLPIYIPINNVRNAAVSNFPILPPMPAEIAPTHLAPTVPTLIQPIPPTVVVPPTMPSNYSMEPLNLSSSNKLINSSQDLSVQKRGGIPARRQTICGFEARDFLCVNDMLPLDLSKKSCKIDTSPIPKTAESFEANKIISTGAKNMSPVLVSPGITSAVLKTVAVASSGLNTTIPAIPSDTLISKQFYSNLDLLKIPQIPRSNVYVTPVDLNLNTQKTNIKKRTCVKNTTQDLPIKSIVATVLTQPQAQPSHLVQPKEVITQKKDISNKNKSALKMDEEVINHIDDAINSVINAVKASLQQEEEYNSLSIKQPLPELPQQMTQQAPTLPPKQIMPPKRTMRSKTMDCRPASLSVQIKENNFKQINNLSNSPNPIIPIQLQQQQQQQELLQKENSDIIKPDVASHITNTKEKPTVISCHNDSKNNLNHLDVNIKIDEFQTTVDKEKSEDTKSTNEEVVFPEKLSKDIEKEICTDQATAVVVPLTETNIASIPNESIENVNSINNTSSGFHSSLQSDIANESKKKQRRRRKNELAAIVADQLLESFKIDSARRDNLKKLENLAYEKSEDLLLTGMLLMSTTKRSAASVFGKTQQSFTDRPLDNAKRGVKCDEIKSSKNKKLTDNIKQNPDCNNEIKEIDLKKGKRRSYRRKGRTLDNENISKLKSSLESFSIGIENKLNEYESKIANSLNTDNASRTPNPSELNSNIKPVISILRPSILSSTLEPTNQLNSKNETIENKMPVFSRDPRLNKNIHKHERNDAATNEVDEATNISARTRLRSANENEKHIDEIGDLEEDNYLTEIAKNVNEKIMSAENEDFISNDGFELANDMHDDSNSKFYRPPTSLSVRSAPSFNDDISNFGSMCDENTNTEVMDMDLDDELSVYTSYSQDVGRGRGRRRRRRRSILLKRRPKKRPGRDLSAEKFECFLCKKTFFSANSLSKHNMTLAHVSKVSEQEYLQSKSMQGVYETAKLSQNVIAKVAASTISKTTSSSLSISKEVLSSLLTKNDAPTVSIENTVLKSVEQNQTSHNVTSFNEKVPVAKSLGLGLNPDERLFYECCNILKGTENSTKITSANNQTGFMPINQFAQKAITIVESESGVSKHDLNNCHTDTVAVNTTATVVTNNLRAASRVLVSEEKPLLPSAINVVENVFRDPPMVQQSATIKTTSTHTALNNESNRLSPNYSAISQFSAVTNNTTSRFKTKAAMKGYENEHIEFTLQRESRTTCKLTELADIALGSQNPNCQKQFPSIVTTVTENNQVKPKESNECDAITSIKHQQKEIGSLHLSRERPKNTETQHSSTSSKTIMHSSIIKAAVKEHNNSTAHKIIIPERPFKNIGLEEKESITFQKPNTNSLSLLNDENSVSTVSYSDRDDYDFGTLSCDEEETNIKTVNDKINKNSSDSSSSRATAKTFENKSLIMGRIFKNASTKSKAPVKSVKSVVVQKDQQITALQKADLNQLFDELRGGDGADAKARDVQISPFTEQPSVKSATTLITSHVPAASAIKTDVVDLKTTTTMSTTATTTTTTATVTNATIATTTTTTKTTTVRKSKTDRKKSNVGRKSRKDISKLQTELGMSPEEIEKLIDDGQRKSKRRCATNTQRKLVEIWSSDEYEEFLSTKDIIALIEEKEQQEKRRKRKTSVNNGSLQNEIKEKDFNIVQSGGTMVKSKEEQRADHWESTETSAKNVEIPHRAKIPNSSKINGGDGVEIVGNPTATVVKKNILPKSRSIEISESEYQIDTSYKCANKPTKHLVKDSDVSLSSSNNKINTKVRSRSKATEAAQTIVTASYNEMSANSKSTNKKDGTSKNIEHFAVSNIQTQIPIQSSSTRRSAKARKVKNNTKSDPNDISTPTSMQKEIVKKESNIKKRNNKDNNNYNNNNTITKKTKANKKLQSKPKSSSRRKRPATEKLYYWSSSSDEEFGRIDKTEAEEYTDGSEHYQKHGWIVGDSHKKLVTLLAIAKGNKKVENCGVKKNFPKKKT